jgi:hypothetical protein
MNDAAFVAAFEQAILFWQIYRGESLFKSGKGIREISRELQLHRVTLKKYLQTEIAVPKNVGSSTKIFLFEDYIKNAVVTRPGVRVKTLYEEIKAMGYKGKKSVENANIAKYMPQKGRIIYPEDSPTVYWKPAQVIFYYIERLAIWITGIPSL